MALGQSESKFASGYPTVRTILVTVLKASGHVLVCLISLYSAVAFVVPDQILFF